MNSIAQSGTGAIIPEINKNTVDEFSKLWVQGVDGRIEPLSTLNSEIVRKISHKSALYGKSADEVVLSMMAYPEIWRTLLIVRVSDKTVAAQLGTTEKYITIEQVFDEQGNYRISQNVQQAYEKDLPETFDRIGIKTIKGQAEFIDNHHVEVDYNTISSKTFIVAAVRRA